MAIGRPRTLPPAEALSRSELRRRLAARLDEAIKADGRSTRELAVAAWGEATRAAVISRWRSGAQWPKDPVLLEELAAVLGRDPGSFFDRDLHAGRRRR